MPPSSLPPVPLLSAGLAALQSGDAAAAEVSARHALTLHADDADWLTVLALALSQQQRAAEALPVYERLVALHPQVGEHWSNFGNCLCELGRERDALEPLQRALACGTRSAELHYALARAWVAHGDPRRALDHLKPALAAYPQDPEFQLLRARALVMIDEYEMAGQAIDALRRAGLTPALHVEAGNLLLELGLYADAQACFEAVPAGVPERTDAELGLAAVHERCNRLPQAEALAQSLAAQREGLNPHQLDLLLELEAQLATRRDQHALARERMQELLQRPSTDAQARGDLWLKLGRCLDALGESEAAMQALASGHAERFALVTRTHAALPHGDGLLAVLDAPVPAMRSPLAADALAGEPADPVFLVGFPRSGTTLLEQLLDAHAGLASFDEQPFLQRLVTRINERHRPGYPEAIADLTEADARAAPPLPRRRRARAAAARRAPGGRQEPTEPGAAAAGRHAVPAGPGAARAAPSLRCGAELLQQNFRSPAFAITFETLASTAAMYARVMAHFHAWRERLPLPLHVVRYEDLVADVSGVGQALFGFLGLPWSEDLAAFTERARRKGAISTPSYAQVVKPVNQRAVGRWQRYRAWFEGEPLDTLQPWIERLRAPAAQGRRAQHSRPPAPRASAACRRFVRSGRRRPDPRGGFQPGTTKTARVAPRGFDDQLSGVASDQKRTVTSTQ
ncbi:MAG: sulfotransferase [Rhodanobacteraceae bacterium]|nr:sulfotransferase [Rhodanobacteraceae bacterium]